MLRRWGVYALLCLAGCAAFLGWLAHIGYFGGPVYIQVPAQITVASPLQQKGQSAPRIAAVLLSGDMGFAVGMGPQIAQRLSADGIPVLGVSSLTYFRQHRSPADVERLVTTAARRALSWGHADRLILIGQSFGADMLHVGATALPPDLRQKVTLVALIVPGESVIFRASPAELFNWATPEAPALPTAQRLNWVPLLCVSGRDENNSLCPHLPMANVHWVALPGGHPLHRDTDALYATLRTAIVRTTTTAPAAAPIHQRNAS